MKRWILSLVSLVSILGLMACSAPADSDYETLHEKCKNKPSLPECQDDVQEDDSLMDED
ncbi:MAG: hypothetical protein II835_12220 [Fibrobacter sp.]|uniref:hypothetical protein n=1 Tax=uncultured Fibrobacter sp. TaxID=261512 RepID=UPI0025ED0BE6|nr:hypothetical protein [uncultured Fibrobacter sp.]MBQ3778815.1 hypothetical protein [Fibrobacter sp.]